MYVYKAKKTKNYKFKIFRFSKYQKIQKNLMFQNYLIFYCKIFHSFLIVI